jgi:molybdate transport system ATP-binding protein
MSLIFENVDVIRNEFLVLNNINFEIKNKENWAIIGPSGGGKSTLLDVLVGKLFVTKGLFKKKEIGTVCLVNRDYGFHKIVGSAYQYYQQRFNAFDAEIGPTLYEVLQNQITPIGTINANSFELKQPLYTKNWVEKICSKLKIEHLLTQKITSLSNGETRRSLLAIALLKKPNVLLLDNPFTGLDTQSRAELKIILTELNDTQIILVAAETEIPENINNLIVLSKGEIIYKGNKKNYDKPRNQGKTKTQSLLNKIYLSQNKENTDFTEALKINNGWVKYGEKQVLNNINWTVKTGEKWALLGPNGSGKSSLLSIITGDNPQCYQNDLWLFDKKRGTGESIWDLKKKMGFVSPELHMYFNKNISVWKAIGSGFFDTAGLFKQLTDIQLELIDLYLELLHISAYKNRRLNQLSFGQQRLVFLARALVKNPPVLILDEPCQGLDYNQMVFFRELLNEIAISQKKTLIFVSHYEDEIPACVNKKLYLENGVVVKMEI